MELLDAFTAGLLLITVSELGDKTFCIAMLLAMRYSRRLVFAGVVAALAAMTMLSVGMGQFARLLPPQAVKVAAIGLFLGFGLKLLYDARQMPKSACQSELAEAANAIDQNFSSLSQRLKLGIVFQAFWLTFVAEWGDRTQFATVALAAAKHPLGVTAGAILGHTICAAIAVIGGRLIANRISERLLTAIGGGLFILFAAFAWLEK